MSHNNGKVSVISAGAQPQVPDSPTRIPKLRVRTQVDQDAITPVETSPVIGSNSSDGGHSNDRHFSSPNGPNTAPIHNHAWHDGSPKAPNKEEKRKRGVMSFFTLKEPSTSAWADFVQQQKDDAALRGVNPPTIANKKLPDNVPKVNSKWDGLPSVARSRSNTSSSWQRSTATTPPASKRSEEVKFGGSPNNVKAHTAGNSRSLNTSASGPTGASTSTSSSGHIRGSSSRSTPQEAASKAAVLGPSMSTETMTKNEPVGDLSEFSSVPMLSLFFPNASTGSDTQSQPNSASLSSDPAPSYRLQPASSVGIRPAGAAETANISATPNLSPGKNIDPSKLGHAPTLGTSEVEDESAEAPEVSRYRRRPYDSSSESTAGSSPYNPPTPEAPIPVVSTKQQEHPATVHSRKRSAEGSPQWPLAGSVIPTTALDNTPAIPPRSPRRTSASSQEELLGTRERSGSESEDERLFLDGITSLASKQSSQQSSARSSVRSFSRPLPVSPPSSSRSSPGGSSSGAAPMGTVSIVRNNQTYTPSGFRAPPAMLPGRVVTKDSDLATIPESDTASVRTLSVYKGKRDNGGDDLDKSLRTTLYLSDTDDSDADEAGDVDDDSGVEADAAPQARAGATEPRGVTTPPTSSGPVEDLRKSPRERLGLGSLIRRNDGKGASTLWAPDSDGEDDGAGATDSAKRSGLKAVFRRG